MAIIKKYICGVDFQYELGYASDIHFYDSLEELMEKSKCWEECGIVELKIADERIPEVYSSRVWIKEMDLKFEASEENFISPKETDE
jgi:hypothetical protein